MFLRVEGLSPAGEQVAHDPVAFLEVVNLLDQPLVNKLIKIHEGCLLRILQGQNELKADRMIDTVGELDRNLPSKLDAV